MKLESLTDTNGNSLISKGEEDIDKFMITPPWEVASLIQDEAQNEAMEEVFRRTREQLTTLSPEINFDRAYRECRNRIIERRRIERRADE